MSPSFSSKNGVRYRFYISSALLRGRKATAGSVRRVPAAEIECAVLAALKTHQGRTGSDNGPDLIKMLERVVVARNQLLATISGPGGATDVNGTSAQIKIAWSPKTRDTATVMDNEDAHEIKHNESLVRSIVRAQAWVRSLEDGTFESIEALAEANRIHPKLVRQALRLAFLSPPVASAILEGWQPASLSLARIPKLLPLAWTGHQSLLILFGFLGALVQQLVQSLAKCAKMFCMLFVGLLKSVLIVVG